MPGTVTGTGTFTGLATDLRPMRDSAMTDSELSAINIAPADLRTPPDEIRQTILMFQNQWGQQLPGATAGTRLNFWATVVLLRAMLTSYVNFGVTRVGP